MLFKFYKSLTNWVDSNYNIRLTNLDKQWYIAMIVYMSTSLTGAWDVSEMAYFPQTLAIAHLVVMLTYMLIYALCPIVLLIAFTFTALKITVVAGHKAVMAAGLKMQQVLAFGIKVLGLPTLNLLITLNHSRPVVKFRLLDIYQRCEEIFDLDGYDYALEKKIDWQGSGRAPEWWVKCDDDWFDESNPRLIRMLNSKQFGIRDCAIYHRELITADRKLKAENPVEHARLAAEKAAAELAKAMEPTFEERMREAYPEAFKVMHFTREESAIYFVEKNREYVDSLINLWREHQKTGLPLFPAESAKPVIAAGRVTRHFDRPLWSVKLTEIRLMNGKIKNDRLKRDIEAGNFEHTVYDFSIPCSSEFRSIIELYSFVVWVLLLVFTGLIVALIFTALKPYRDLHSAHGMGYCTPRLDENGKPTRFIMKKKWWNDKKWEDTYKKYPSAAPVLSRLIWVIREYRKTEFAKFRAGTGGDIYWIYLSRLEAIWTSLPVMALIAVSLPSFALALGLDESHKPQHWLKVNGNQWFWTYEFSNYTGAEGDNSIGVLYSNIAQGADLTDNSLRLLEVDASISIPLNRFTRLLITSTDVIHSFAIPSMGLKVDACPGRINAVTILPTRGGVYYGQCSEICGVNHAFMPICMEVVA